jgi:hypothetical protein
VQQEIRDLDIEVILAERAVESARAKLSSDLEVASASGRRVVARLTRQARPVLIGVAAVATVALIVGTFRRTRLQGARFRNQQPFLLPQHQQSPTGRIVRATIRLLARAIAIAIVRRAIRALVERQIAREGQDAEHSMVASSKVDPD